MAKNFLKNKDIQIGENQVKLSDDKPKANDFVYYNHDFFVNAKQKAKDIGHFAKEGTKTSLHAARKGVRTARIHSAESIVRYTPDVYDKHQDVATGSLSTLAGLSVQVSRTALRSKRSIQNAYHNSRVNQYSLSKNEIEKKIKIVKEKMENGENVAEELRELKDQLNEVNKLQIKHNSKINSQRGLRPGDSIRRTFNNQFRKAIGSVASKNDIASNTIGKTVQSVYYVNRYKTSIKTVGKMISAVVSGILSAIVGFITSIPAMIAALISILPLLLIVIAVLAILLNFVDLSVSGRVSALADSSHKINELYDVSIEPEYVLAISQELGWTTGKEKNYERLYSLMLDQKKSQNISFDKMIENVFIKYNPLKNGILDTIYNEKEYTPYVFYSNTGMNVIGTQTQKISYGDLIDLYPKYRDHPDIEKEKFNIDDIKKRCHDSLKYNQDMYLKYMSTFSGFAAGDSKTGNDIAQIALTMKGHLYYWGGSGEIKTTKTSPPMRQEVFDCSGLVYWAHTKANVPIGRSTANMYGKMGKTLNKSQLQAGDVITFDWDKNGIDDHIVIYIGNGYVVGAEGKGSGTYANDIDQCVKVYKLDTKSKYISKMRRLY